ncbi:MAG: CDP-glycerol glycerophosphotransferase family protein [Patescibacteria group bacterium]
MKTIIIPISNSFTIRNVLYTDTLRLLLAEPDIRIVFLAPRDKIDHYRSQFTHARIIFEIMPELKKLRQERFFRILESSSIHSRTVSMIHWFDLKRDGSRMGGVKRLILFLLRRCAWWAGQWRAWRTAVRILFYLVPSRIFREIFETYNPDLVFCPAMVYGEPILSREAKKYGITTVGMILSWDNLYSKTFLRAPPDCLLVHTNSIRNQAIAFADYPEDRIVVTGIPQYDSHFQRTGLKSREEFIGKELGGDPSKKLLLYVMSGKAGLSIEFDILDIIYKAIQNKEIEEDIDVLIRPYPRYDFPQKKLDTFKKEYGFLAKQSMIHVGTGADNWEFNEDSLALLENSLMHANVVVTMFSTFFIEAAVYDKPLIAIAFDGYKIYDYYNSARRFFDWDHLAEIKPLGGICFAMNKEGLIKAINEYIKNPALLQDGRRRIVEQQSGFTDGKAGERVANVLLDLISKSTT